MPGLLSLVRPGDRVDIAPRYVKASSSDDEKKEYRTRVFDMVSDDEIKLNMPMEGSKLVLLSVGYEYELCFYSQSGLYQCTAVVKERYKSNNIFIVAMELSSGLRKHQRREYYRLNCILDMKCTEVNAEAVKRFENHVEFLETDFQMRDGTIVDISGGGIRFLSSVQYPPETNIMFMFNLQIGGRAVDFKTIGRIIMSEGIENRPGLFENRVQFVTMGTDERENIIRYIFEEERKIRRKEKG